jgi:predicted DCC family thiol-disulfide oxidoreductase YuxK
VLRFASLQSRIGQALCEAHGVPTPQLDTLILLDGDRVFTESAAVLRLTHYLGGIWTLLRLLRWLPRPLRDAAYRLVARKRYGWFGRLDACWMPSNDVMERFLK